MGGFLLSAALTKHNIDRAIARRTLFENDADADLFIQREPTAPESFTLPGGEQLESDGACIIRTDKRFERPGCQRRVDLFIHEVSEEPHSAALARIAAEMHACGG